MWGLVFFISVIVVAMVVSRKNYRNRATLLLNNLQEFSLEIKDTFFALSEENKTKFKNALNQDYTYYLEALLEDKINYGNNVWTIQQHMIKQEELMIILNKLNCNK